MHAQSGHSADVGRYREPLRDIAVTVRYMHDGSIATLSEVQEHDAVGGPVTTGSWARRGGPNDKRRRSPK